MARIVYIGSDAPISGGEEPLQRKLKTKGEETESQRCDAERDRGKEGRQPGERPRPTRTDLLQGRDQQLVPDMNLGLLGTTGEC